MRKFFINSKKESGTANLYIQLKAKSIGRMLLNTGIEVDIEAYNQSNYFTTKVGKATEKNMQKVDNAISLALEDSGCTTETIRNAVYFILHKDEIAAKKKKEEEEQQLKELAEQQRKAQEEALKRDILLVLDNFIADIKDGSQKHKRGDYSSNTVKVWNSFRGILKEYMKKRSFTWEDINKKRCNQFTAWMQKSGYMPTSINKYLICFKALVRYAFDEHIHNSDEACKAFTKVKFTENDKANEIYLTADEIQALYDMPLSGTLEIYRDVFLIGCYTCQRFSDYSTIEKDNIYTTSNGTRVVKLIQKKTKNTVFVPILNNKLETLLAKYDYNVPDVCDVVMNRYIKEILKELSKSVPSLSTELKTQLTMKERTKEERGEVTFRRDSKGNVVRPRYDMVSTHTARRTGITLLYKSGLFDIVQLMHVSGHKDTKTFLAYIKLSGEEIAEQIAETMKKSEKNPFA